MTRLRHFQQEVKNGVHAAWGAGHKVVMPVLPTGAGKTVIIGDTCATFDGFGVAIAHRAQLVSQIAMALGVEGVRHDIIAPKDVIRDIVKIQIEELGRSFYDPRANWKVASVDTIIKRHLDANWSRRVGLVVQDEGHHVLRDNKWGQAYLMFESARGLFPSATPERADKRGLGANSHGLVDVMVEGPNMRWMIDNGYLTPYRIIGVSPKDLDMSKVEISAATGEYNLDQMRKAVKGSATIVGDVVQSYIEHAMGKLGITFAVDVEHATQLAAEYNRKGVPAIVVSSKTSDIERAAIMRRFVKRELLQLVNVDLFGEGVDVPELEVVSFARPTMSYALYVQQFGRVLRLKISKFHAQQWDTYSPELRKQLIAESGKSVGIILDHVANVIVHNGPPDFRRKPWSLEPATKSNKPGDTILMRYCLAPMCQQPYERFHVRCPYCGAEPLPPADRSDPKVVDGDVVLYSPELLEKLFGEIKSIDGPAHAPRGIGPIATAAVHKNHERRKQAQQDLRHAMQLVLPTNLDPRVAAKKFYLEFGVDTLTAQTLGSAEAEKLKQEIIQRVSRT